MFTVALIGADGSGKTTMARRLKGMLPVPVKYLYLGINLETSKLVLPTTRLLLEIKRMRGRRPDLSIPRREDKLAPLPRNWVKRVVLELKSALRVLNLMAEEWFHQGVIWHYQRRGYVVLLDRHFFFDYYFHDGACVAQHSTLPQKSSIDTEVLLSNRLHGFVLKRFYPKPDLVILLDAPAEVLVARKSEGTIELIESRRQEYLSLRDLFKNFVTVDATQPQDKVLQQIGDLIHSFYLTELARQNRNFTIAS